MLASDEELKTLIVTRLGLGGEAEFEKIRTMSTRLRIPLERAMFQDGIAKTLLGETTLEGVFRVALAHRSHRASVSLRV